MPAPPELRAVAIQAPAGELPAIAALPYVLSASPDATRNGAPVDTVTATDFAGGISTWDQDAVDATDLGEAGVLIVASAGNEGAAGMGYPGAYPPVISVAASGWAGEWGLLASGAVNRSWWNNRDVADPMSTDDFYIADFSSRALPGQDLDVAAPGSWVVGPYQVNSGQTSYFFLGGTSMASPHVAGIVALMAQKDPTLGQAAAEAFLVSAAVPLPAGCRTVNDPNGVPGQVCWGDDATGAGLITVGSALAAMP